jgi:hypothetical protein
MVQAHDAWNVREIVGTISDVVTLTFLVGGGVWAWWRYRAQAEGVPRVAFSVDVQFIGVQTTEWLVEILGHVTNHGLVPQRMDSLVFEIRYLDRTDAIVDAGEYRGQVIIPNVLKQGSWIPEGNTTAMVLLPGISLRYNYIYRVPRTASFVLLHGLLDYGDRMAPHRADRLLKVPDTHTLAPRPTGPRGGTQGPNAEM